MDSVPEVTEVQDRGPAAYIAEFIGTLLLVFFITAVVSLYAAVPTKVNPTPFIDFSVIVLREIRLPDALIYIVAQLAGGVGGALLTKLLLDDEGKAVNYGATAVSGRLNEAILPGMVVEAIGTFFLVWVIVGVAVNPRATKEWAAFAIGATLGMLVMVIAPLTGAGFNPARSFGPAVVAGEFNGVGEFLLVYVVATVIGAVVAALAYFNLAIAPGKKGLGGAEPV